LFSNRKRASEFEAVAMPHMNDLYRMASRLLGSRERAEDVLQEVYLQAWKSFHRFEPGTNCRAWLFKILINCVHHYRRKWFQLKVVRESEEALEQSAAPAPPVPDRLTDQEILAALDRIPQDYQTVVLLADVEEFAYKEVASILNIPIGTVMSRLSRARRMLREQLADVAQSYGIGGKLQEGQSA
jgi:RNA polymerase sigma-70 factor (ECF subfamily)